MPQPITYPIFLPNKGIVLNKPEEFLSANYSPYSRNMEFNNDLLQGRMGLTKFDTSVLPGIVQLIEQFWKFDGDWLLMIATTKDICQYDFTNSRFNFLNPQYTTGTIEVQAGTPTKLRGDGTLWAANVKAGDYVKIGSGDVHSGSTWYIVDTVDSDTLITLATAAPTTASGTAYVARKTYSGTQEFMWNCTTFQDATLGDTWIAVNGIDTPTRWTGTGLMTALTGLSTAFTSARYVSVYKSRVMFAWTIEGGANQPQRERWSDVADCNSWQDGDFHDFIDDGWWITGICNFGDYHIVFRERDAMICRYVGGYYIFDYEKSNTCRGCYSGKSIVVGSNYIYYYGIDNKFKMWNLTREDDVFGDELFEFTRNFNPNLEMYITGWEVEAKNQIRWLVPYSDSLYNNFCIVYDYAQNIIQIWEYEKDQALCCMGEYLLLDDRYVDEAPWSDYYVDEQTGFWDDRTFLSGTPIILYGGYDGYIRVADSGTDDDGEVFTRLFRSVRNNFSMPNKIKRLKRQQWWFMSRASGEVTIKMRKDDYMAFEAASQVISLISDKDIIKHNITWDKFSENFQFQVEATNHFELLGFLNTITEKGATIS